MPEDVYAPWRLAFAFAAAFGPVLVLLLGCCFLLFFALPRAAAAAAAAASASASTTSTVILPAFSAGARLRLTFNRASFGCAAFH